MGIFYEVTKMTRQFYYQLTSAMVWTLLATVACKEWLSTGLVVQETIRNVANHHCKWNGVKFVLITPTKTKQHHTNILRQKSHEYSRIILTRKKRSVYILKTNSIYWWPKQVLF